jgi:hypothetical protein
VGQFSLSKTSNVTYINIVEHIFMKVSFSIILFLIATRLLGQVDTESIDFQKLIGIDSIVVNDEIGNLESVYNYRSNILIREKHFYQGELVRLISYGAIGSTKFIKSHSKWTTILENGDETESWGDTYEVEVIKTKGTQFLEKEYYESTGADSTLEEKIIPTYDLKGRLIQENVYDHSKGFRNVFKSNSSDFGKGTVKSETLEKIKKYKYELNKLTIEHSINSKPTGREVIELTREGKASRILSLDNKSNKLGETLFSYDSKGRLLEKKSAWYIGQDLWGDTVDFTTPTTERLFYNINGLPTKVVRTNTGRKPTTSNFRYY